MAIKPDALLKYGVPVLALLALMIGLRACQHAGVNATPAASAAQHGRAELTQEQMQALGIEAESPDDTVSTLVAEMHEMQQQLGATQEESAQLREQNKDLARTNGNLHSNLQQAIDQALAEQHKRYAKGRESLLDTLSQRINELRITLELQANGSKQAQTGNGAGTAMPVGLGLTGEIPAGERAGMVWINPLAMIAVASRGTPGGPSRDGVSAFARAFDMGEPVASGGAQTAAGPISGASAAPATPGSQTPPAAITPVYTVPKNSTLVGSVAMSALLGRVPIDGSVQNPYPFKVIIGAENLITNGIMLPEVKGAIVSGSAIGDWTLSCVRGTVRSITFVFQDGTVRTVPESAPPGSQQRKRTQQGQQGPGYGIGYLSNPQGLPCIPGVRKTNARKFILTHVILSAGAAAAGAVAAGQTTARASPFGFTGAVTGDIGRFIAGRAVAQGVNDVREWVEKRFGQTFDAVYVPPGQGVVVNITKMLPIDYEHNGRRVDYVRSTHAQGLD